MGEQGSADVLRRLGLGRGRSDSTGIRMRYLHDHRARDEVDEYMDRLPGESE